MTNAYTGYRFAPDATGSWSVCQNGLGPSRSRGEILAWSTVGDRRWLGIIREGSVFNWRDVCPKKDRTIGCTGAAYAVRRFLGVFGIHRFYSAR